jgi:hypothetical protein
VHPTPTLHGLTIGLRRAELLAAISLAIDLLMSLVLSNRHAFDALGRDLDLDRYTATLPATSAYRDTFHGGTGASLIALASRLGDHDTHGDNTHCTICMVAHVVISFGCRESHGAHRAIQLQLRMKASSGRGHAGAQGSR